MRADATAVLRSRCAAASVTLSSRLGPGLPGLLLHGAAGLACTLLRLALERLADALGLRLAAAGLEPTSALAMPAASFALPFAR